MLQEILAMIGLIGGHREASRRKCSKDGDIIAAFGIITVCRVLPYLRPRDEEHIIKAFVLYHDNG